MNYGLLGALLCVSGCAAAAAPVGPSGAAPAREEPWPAIPSSVSPPSIAPARYLRTLEYNPAGYTATSALAGSARLQRDSDLLLGDLLFHSPRTLGPRAMALGISCDTCHPNGATHRELSISGLTDRPGSVDLSSHFFRRGADNGVSDPVNVPSLRGVRFSAPYGRDGRTASLGEFTRSVVEREFAGASLGEEALASLVDYLLELDFLPNRNLDQRNQLTARASEAARRGALVFEQPRPGFAGRSCASCHPRSTFFRDGAVHRLGTGSPPSPHAVDGGYETPSLLGLAETAPYFHDGRFASIEAVISWFDESFSLALSQEEQADLGAYVEAVGAVDRPRDERPLAMRLDQVFAYISLVPAEGGARLSVAAIDAVLAELRGEPPALAERIRSLRARLLALRRSAPELTASSATVERVRALRLELARLAADWGGLR